MMLLLGPRWFSAGTAAKYAEAVVTAGAAARVLISVTGVDVQV